MYYIVINILHDSILCCMNNMIYCLHYCGAADNFERENTI